MLVSYDKASSLVTGTYLVVCSVQDLGHSSGRARSYMIVKPLRTLSTCSWWKTSVRRKTEVVYEGCIGTDDVIGDELELYGSLHLDRDPAFDLRKGRAQVLFVSSRWKACSLA